MHTSFGLIIEMSSLFCSVLFCWLFFQKSQETLNTEYRHSSPHTKNTTWARSEKLWIYPFFLWLVLIDRFTASSNTARYQVNIFLSLQPVELYHFCCAFDKMTKNGFRWKLSFFCVDIAVFGLCFTVGTFIYHGDYLPKFVRSVFFLCRMFISADYDWFHHLTSPKNKPSLSSHNTDSHNIRIVRNFVATKNRGPIYRHQQQKNIKKTAFVTGADIIRDRFVQLLARNWQTTLKYHLTVAHYAAFAVLKKYLYVEIHTICSFACLLWLLWPVLREQVIRMCLSRHTVQVIGMKIPI